MTITSSSGAAAAAIALAAIVVAAGVGLWRRRVPGVSFGRSLRAAIYLGRYAMALDYYGLGRAEIASHVGALHADLVAVAASGEPGSEAALDAAIDRLGPPRSLAADVAEGSWRPTVTRGSLWFGVAALAVFGVNILVAEAFLGGFEAVAEPGESATWSALGFAADATMGDDGRASEIGFGGFAPLLVPVIAFVVGARPWRLLRRSAAGSRTPVV